MGDRVDVTPITPRPAGGAMTDFVELWVYLSSTPLFGLTATIVVYVLA